MYIILYIFYITCICVYNSCIHIIYNMYIIYINKIIYDRTFMSILYKYACILTLIINASTVDAG